MKRSADTPNRFVAILTALLALTCFTFSAAYADGFVVIRPQPGIEKPVQLAVRYHDVEIQIRDQVAQVAIDQVFRNLNNRPVEGEYIFPIPDGAAVSDFILYVDGKPVRAEAMDAERARGLYEELVRQTKDPALLEYAGRELFRARIFPFPANGDRRVKLGYDHLIERRGGLYRFVYPLATERFSSRPLERALVTIELNADRPIKNAYCPSHDVEIEYLSDTRLRLTWEEHGTTPDRDLTLFYSLAEGPVDVQVVPYRPDSNENGYFMLLASMGMEDEIAVEPKDVIFVVDCSGSMEGEKMSQAKQALLYCLRRLNARDRFAVVNFSGSVASWEDDLKPATNRNIRDAEDYVRRLHAQGGTNISDALARALSMSHRNEQSAYVIFLTDGLPTVGEEDPRRIVNRLKLRGTSSIRVFPFGVGYDVNTILLDLIAEQTSGVPEYIRPSEDIETKVTGFYNQISDPLLTDIEIDIGGAKVEDLHPSRIPDLYRGSQLVLFGRYRGHGDIEITIRGVMEGRRVSFTAENSLPRRTRRNEFVGRLWGTRRVGALLRDLRLHGESNERVDEIKAIGLQFGIVTPYTSFLVDDHGVDDFYSVNMDHEKKQAPATWGLVKSLRRSKHRVSGGATAAAPAPQQYLQESVTGLDAVNLSMKINSMATAETEAPDADGGAMKAKAGRTFLLSDGEWVEYGFADEKTKDIRFGSDDYFKLMAKHSGLRDIFTLGERVVFKYDGKWYRIVPA
jgi:Ca-activated chloride channel homolog